MSSDNLHILLSGIAENSLVNGKGLRKVFFSQGCTHHCKNCFNQSTWPFEGGKEFLIQELVDKAINEPFLDGVTFSGGDPFQQPKAFGKLAKELHENKINIWAYTGYYYEELLELAKKDPDIDLMLHNIDILVDGPFIQEEKDEDIAYRGSRNQRIIDVPLSLKKSQTIILNYDKK